MSALSDLQEVMRLVGAVGPQWSYELEMPVSVSAGNRAAASSLRIVYIDKTPYLHPDDAAAAVAAINFLRTHAEAMAKEAREAERYRKLRDATEGPFIADWHADNSEDVRQLTGAIADAAVDAAIGAGGSNG